MSKLQKDFYITLESIRGIAAVLVVIRHMPQLFNPFRSPTSFLAVDIFFLLSGFVLAVNYEEKIRSGSISASQFFMLRLIRIYPLYVVASAIGFILVLIGAQYSAFSAGYLFSLAIFFVPNPSPLDVTYPLVPPAWSLFSEVAISAVYVVWLVRTSVRTAVAFIIASGLLLLFSIIYYGSADIGGHQSTFWAGLPRVAFSFGCGVLIYRLKPALERRIPPMGNRATLILFFMVFCLLIAPIRQSGSLAIPYDVIVIFFAFPLLIAVATFAKPGGSIAAISIILGRISFPLYVFHWPLSILFTHVARTLFHVNLAVWSPISGIIVLAFLVCFALLADEYLDRPTRAFLRRALTSLKLKTVKAK